MRRFILSVLTTAFGLAVASAQPATPAQMAGVTPDPGYATCHFQTRIGSFKIIDGVGRVEIDFTGTVLVNRLEGTLSVTGQVRKEYDRDGRVVWTGRGKAVATGKWRGVQWFGRDLRGVWYGRGVIRFGGEFDRDGRSGEFWFDDPAKPMFWPSGTTSDYPVPPISFGQNKNIKVKTKKSGK